MTIAPTPEIESLPTRRGSWPGSLLIELVFLLAAGGFIAWSRGHTAGAPLDPDEANYAYIGERLFAGDRLYVDVWDHQPPLVFVLFGAVQRWFGSDEAVFRGMATCFSAGTLLFVHMLMRQSYGRWVAACASLIWALASMDPGTEGDGANREIYMNTFSVLGVWLLTRFGRSPSPRTALVWLLLAGTSIGVASAFKTIVAVLWLFVLPWLAWVVLRRDSASAGAANQTAAVGAGKPLVAPAPSRSRLWQAEPWQGSVASLFVALLVFGLGPALIWLGQLAWFAADGRTTNFIDAVFRYNVGYSARDVGEGSNRLVMFFTAQRWALVPAAALWCVAPLGLLVGRWRRPPTADLLIRLYALAAFIEVMLPGHFWRHYYYLLMPPLALLVGLLVDRILSWGSRGGAICTKSPPRLALSLIPVALIIGLLIPSQVRWYYTRDAEELSFLRFSVANVWAKHLGGMLATMTAPGDYVYQFGDAVGIYHYAGRRTPNRYTMISPLVEEAYPGFAERRAALLEDFKRQDVSVVLLGYPPWPEFYAHLEREYQLVADLAPAGQTVMRIFVSKRRPPKFVPRPDDWIWTPADGEKLQRVKLNEVARWNIWREEGS